MVLGLRHSNLQASSDERTVGGGIGAHQFLWTFLRDSLTGRVPHRCTSFLPHLVGCAVHPVSNTLDGADEKITLGRSGHFLVLAKHAVGRRGGELTSVLQVTDYRQDPPPCRSSHVREASHEHHGIAYVLHHLVRERRAQSEAYLEHRQRPPFLEIENETSPQDLPGASGDQLHSSIGYLVEDGACP